MDHSGADESKRDEPTPSYPLLSLTTLTYTDGRATELPNLLHQTAHKLFRHWLLTSVFPFIVTQGCSSTTVFISYSWANHSYADITPYEEQYREQCAVRQFAQDLQYAGLTVWLDLQQAQIGDPLVSLTESAIAKSNGHFVLGTPVYLSKYRKSKTLDKPHMVYYEVCQIEKHLPNPSYRLFPLILSGTAESALPTLFHEARRLHVDLSGDKDYFQACCRIIQNSFKLALQGPVASAYEALKLEFFQSLRALTSMDDAALRAEHDVLTFKLDGGGLPEKWDSKSKKKVTAEILWVNMLKGFKQDEARVAVATNPMKRLLRALTKSESAPPKAWKELGIELYSARDGDEAVDAAKPAAAGAGAFRPLAASTTSSEIPQRYGLSSDRQQAFIRGYFYGLPDSEIPHHFQATFSRWIQNPTLATWVCDPLTLERLCWLMHQDPALRKDLEQGRISRVYDRVLGESMSYHLSHNEEYAAREDEVVDVLKRWLGQLAFVNALQGRSDLPESRIQDNNHLNYQAAFDALELTLEQAFGLVGVLRSKGRVRHDGASVRSWIFRHAAHQAFCAAWYLCDLLINQSTAFTPPWEALVASLITFMDQGHPVYRLLLGLLSDRDQWTIIESLSQACARAATRLPSMWFQGIEELNAERFVERIDTLHLWADKDVVIANELLNNRLHHAATQGYRQSVQYALAQGADIEASNTLGQTALHLAIQYKHARTARYLMAQGADVFALDSVGRSLLHVAAAGQEDLFYELLERSDKAFINTQDVSGEAPLHLVTEFGHIEMLKALIEHGAEINIQYGKSWTALHIAAKQGDLDIVCYLVTRGAALEAKNDTGETPLTLAKVHGHEAVAAYLQEAESDTAHDTVHTSIESTLASRLFQHGPVSVRDTAGADEHKSGDWGEADAAKASSAAHPHTPGR